MSVNSANAAQAAQNTAAQGSNLASSQFVQPSFALGFGGFIVTPAAASTFANQNAFANNAAARNSNARCCSRS